MKTQTIPPQETLRKLFFETVRSLYQPQGRFFLPELLTAIEAAREAMRKKGYVFSKASGTWKPQS